MKKITTFITGIIGLSITAGIGYMIYKFFFLFFSNINKIDINLLIAILGGTITISGFFITRYLERKKSIEFEIRNKKIPIYEEFFEFYFKVMFQNKTDNGITNEEMVNFFRNFNQKAIIWFPDNILKEYITWKNNIILFSKENIELKEMLLLQEDFMKQIREDIGHNNKNIQKWDISSLYINDLENYR
ncbi:hypothetical protein [Chryseobacterium sp.]|uniref:hypothetical protein n=1 Tax=Chryseobacterium sp. TaxID=1871047 RepID=UPI00388FA67B